MNLSKVIEFMGGKQKLAKALKLVPSNITSWGRKKVVPSSHTKKTRKALESRKKKLDRLYNDLTKEQSK